MPYIWKIDYTKTISFGNGKSHTSEGREYVIANTRDIDELERIMTGRADMTIFIHRAEYMGQAKDVRRD